MPTGRHHENRKQWRDPFHFLQFSAIGISNAIVDMGTLNLLLYIFQTEESGWLFVFNTIAYSLAVSNSYFWNAGITFGASFIIPGDISLGVNNFVFRVFSELFRFSDVTGWLSVNIIKGIAMRLSFTASFL